MNVTLSRPCVSSFASSPVTMSGGTAESWSVAYTLGKADCLTCYHVAALGPSALYVIWRGTGGS
jgi:hypothetical protein